MGYLVGAVTGALLLGVMPYPLLVPVALLALLLFSEPRRTSAMAYIGGMRPSLP